MFRSEQRRRREWPRCRPRAHRAVVLLSFLSFSLSFSLFSAHFSFYCSALSPSLIHFAFRSEKRMAEMEATSAQNSHALFSPLSFPHLASLPSLFFVCLPSSLFASLVPFFCPYSVQERAEKEVRMAETQATRAQNMLLYERDIMARPKKAWFQV